MLTSVALLGGHGTYVRRAAFSMDGSRFLLACSSGRIAIYTRDGELVTETMAPPSGILDPVLSSAWSGDDAHVATIENGTLRLRSTVDLAVLAERDSGSGPVAFCDGGRLLAFGAPDRSLHIFDVPGLGDRGGVPLECGDYQVFDIDDIATDPTGTFVASSDNGGYSENEIGGSAGHGLPKVTIIDPHKVTEVRTIEQGRPSSQLELDRWRKRLLVVAYTGIGVWDVTGTKQTMFQPYAVRQLPNAIGHIAAKVVAICEHWLATVPETSFTTHSLDFWDPTTYAKLATSDALAKDPRWISASPDGTRLVAPEPGGVRVWATAAP